MIDRQRGPHTGPLFSFRELACVPRLSVEERRDLFACVRDGGRPQR